MFPADSPSDYPGDPGTYPDASGWYGLLGIVRSVREDGRRLAAQPGSECPIDGTPLLPGRNGKLWCPFDGWSGTPAQAMPAGPFYAAATVSADDPYPVLYAPTY